MIILLYELFQTSSDPKSIPFKILISSATNIAGKFIYRIVFNNYFCEYRCILIDHSYVVDRILLGLLKLGFQKLLRVGSLKKMAKEILPYAGQVRNVNDGRRVKLSSFSSF